MNVIRKYLINCTISQLLIQSIGYYGMILHPKLFFFFFAKYRFQQERIQNLNHDKQFSSNNWNILLHPNVLRDNP